MRCCPKEAHEALKVDRATWLAGTVPLRNGRDGGEVWRDCANCESTIVRPLDGLDEDSIFDVARGAA